MDPNQGFLGPFRAFNEAQAAAYLAQYKDAFGQTAASRHINTRTEPAARVPSSSPSGAKSFDLENAVRPLLEGDSDIRPFQSHLFLPFVAAIMTSESILEQVRSILGPDLLVWFTEWHTKPPLSKKGYAPHQDSTYAGLEPPEDVVTVWVALTAATKANGCLQFVPMRRYNGRQLPHIEEPGDPSNALLKGQYIPRATLDFEENAEFVELQAGEATIHAFRCVHASGPNTTSSPRVGLAIRYMKPSVQQLAGQRREGAMLVSGKDEWGHFDLLPVPCEAWREEGLMLHRKEMEAMQVNYMRQQQEGQKEEG
ncbi:hypothetical protein VYU27_000360 [Nannochloropsis oceanica]